MAELKKKLKKRTGHRAFITQTLKATKDCVDQEKFKENIDLTFQLKSKLSEQLELVQVLDGEILDLLTGEVGEKEDGDAILAKEICDAGGIRSEIKTALRSLDRVMKEDRELQDTASSLGEVRESGSGLQSLQHKVYARLPKLEMSKFTGKPEQWQEFWDTFESSVHKNPDVADIDKFAYLRRYVTDLAKPCIAGFRTTAANYHLAVEALHQRFGKKSVIQQAHIDALMNMQPVFHDWDAARLRKLYDLVECNHRGLQALAVDPVTYQSIVVPAIVKKLPEGIRLQLTRGKDFNTWTVDELLDYLRVEVELREEHYSISGQKFEKKIMKNISGNQNDARPISASTLTTKTVKSLFCAYCKGNHLHEDCTEITDVNERKKLIRKYGRCFVCMRKGHMAGACNSNLICAVCKGKHHVSICDKNSGDQATVIETSQSPTLHVGVQTGIVLQTAQGLVKGNSKPVKVRVLFDSGSQRSFITSRTVQSAGLVAKRKEWLEISTFGQEGKDRGLKEVFELEIESLDRKRCVKMEAYAVQSISSIKNEHIERRKAEFSHLKGLWFSDVCKSKEQLEVDILIGSDYLWCFQVGGTRRGELHEPVAVETKLGWVLSGPMKGARKVNEVNVNFVGHTPVIAKKDAKPDEDLKELEKSVQKWGF